MEKFKKFSRLFLVTTVLFLTVAPVIQNMPAYAAIASTDYFQLTAAGDATTMDSGATLVFTVNAKVQAGTAKTLAENDYAFIEMMSSGTYNETVGADITAVGGGVTVKPSVATPWGGTTAADVSGTSDRLVAINIDGTGTGTFTVRATESFNVFVWAQGANMNKPDTGEWNDAGTPPGQDNRQITVSNASSGADHLKADFGSATTAEVNEQKTVTITQINSGGGLVTSALTDAVIDVNATSVASATQTGLMESSSDHGLDINNVVKFTSAANTSAYYVVSTDASNTTFKVIGAGANLIYSNSNVRKVSGMSAGQTNLTHAGNAGAITANTASTINMQSTTNFSVGDIVSVPGSAGYYSITTVNAGTSIVVVGPTACDATCLTENQNVTKITLTDGDPGAYTVSEGAGADGYIYSVGGVATGNTTTTVVTGKTLTSGTLSAVVVSTEEGTFTVTPYSPTVNVSLPTTDSLTTGAATNMTIQGYGPPTGQTNVPTMAPIDFFLSKNPSTTITFPLTNATDSAFSITSGGVAIPGQWNYSTENWGANPIYRVTFSPTTPLSSSTVYVVSVLKSFASSKGSTDLVSGDTAWTSTITTGTGGGAYTGTGGFTGTMGGKFPPIAMMGYPQPGEWEIPTNISCVVVNFDRPMSATDLTTSNIYIKKNVSGVLSGTLPAGTETVTVLGDDNDSVCIAGYTYEASSEYCVVVDNDVKDAEGNTLAGMPGTSAEGCGSSGGVGGMGFGFSNMGPFEEPFHTGTGSVTVTASMLGTNLNTYLSGGVITAVPVGFIPRVSFNGPLNPGSVTTTNVTLKKNGTVSTAGSVYYDSMDNSVEFVPDAVLSASTNYTLNMSASVTSISGTAITAITQSFTTGAADSTKPQVAFADADNYGISIQFNEPLNKTTAENGSYYTLKTCSASTIAADGATCGSGSPTTVSLLSGVNVHYERNENTTWMDGLTLTPGDGFYIGVSSSVTDITGNGFHATENKAWTGTVMDGSKFDGGGQGMFNQGTMGMEDFNMKNMGMMPVSAFPMNSMASTTTIYFIDMPLTSAIPQDGYIELTFPVGTDVSGVLQDQYSPMNGDFNGPGTGSPTFKAGVTSSVSTDTASSGSGTLDDGLGYIAAARKVYVQLSAATQATDFLHMDIAGIKNPSEPKDFDTTGYQVDVKTFNVSGTLLESKTTMPFFINAAGTNTISGQITAGGAGVNGVRVFLDSWSAGFQETTTSLNGAGDLVEGNNAGEYTFGNLPNGDYHIFISPQNVGGTDYSEANYNIDDVASATAKNISLTAQNSTNCATLPITVNIANIGNITSLGATDSVDVFGWNTTGMGGFTKTLTRTQVINSVATPVNVFVCNAGMYNVGIGPAIPKGNFSAFPKMEWIPPQNQNVNVLTTDIDETKTTFSTTTFAVSAPDATITGIVKDSSGTAVSGGKVFADFSAGGFGGNADIGVDGTFSIPASKNKSYKVGAFIPGMPPAQEHFININSSGVVYFDGNTTASTGSSGANPLVITMQFNSANSITVSGRVSDGTNAIAGAGVWAHRTDAQRPPVNGFTDSSGNYILYIPEAGTWQVEANAPGLGFLGSKTLTVTTEDFTGQDFEPLAAASMGIIAGDISVPGTDDDSGVVVTAYNADGYFNTAITESDGTYTMDVPKDADAYTVTAWSPNLGELAKTTQVVDGTETVSPATLGTPQTFTVTLEEAVSSDTSIDLTSTTGMGTDVIIPAGETVATVTVPEGNYYLNLDLPFDETGATVSGAEFNAPGGTPVTTDEINIDGTGDNITVTLPDLNTLSGTIEDNGAGVENAVVTIIDTDTMDIFTVLTDSDGNYTAEIPDGIYSVMAEQSGYVGTPEDINVTANLTNQDIPLDPADQTIEGTITNSIGTPVEGALVYATMAGGGMVTDETDASGNYKIYASDGMWNIMAVTDGYNESVAPVAVNATNANVIDADIQLPATTVTLENPATATIDSGNANKFADTDLDIELIAPANAVDSDAVINFDETNELPVTPSANPFSTGIDITGTTTNDSTTIDSFDNPVDIVFEYTIAELATEGIDTPIEMNKAPIAYMNGNTNNWTVMPTTITYYNSTGTVIPGPTIGTYATFAAAVTGADLTTISLATTTDHLTLFAPIITTGATPPATPSGLAASGGNAQVTLTWSKNGESDMSSYNIWEANITDDVASTLTQASCTTNCTKTISNLTNGTAYAYQIAAVDSEGDTSAYCTAVNVAPVAPTVTPGGGSPLGGSSGSKKSAADEEEEEVEVEVSEISETVYTEPYEIGTDGKVTAEMTLMASEDEVAAVTFEKDTVVTTNDDAVYIGSIEPPRVIDEYDVVPPADTLSTVGEVYEVGSTDTPLYFSKNVTLRLPLPEDANEYGFYDVYYFDVTTNNWELAGEGDVKKLGDGSLVVEVLVDHFTKFVVMEDLSYEVDAVEEEPLTPFVDVSGHWAKTFIEDLYLREIISGYDDTHFGPDNKVTRAEFTKIALTAFGIELPEEAEEEIPFKDVSADDWYAPYVSAAHYWDIVSGYEDNTFRPHKYINRAEAMRILLDASGMDITTEHIAEFMDVSTEDWYAKYINFATDMEIISGYGNGNFGPGNNLLRGEVSKIVSLLMKNLEGVVGMIVDMVKN